MFLRHRRTCFLSIKPHKGICPYPHRRRMEMR
jgi:hypothetical protein